MHSPTYVHVNIPILVGVKKDWRTSITINQLPLYIYTYILYIYIAYHVPSIITIFFGSNRHLPIVPRLKQVSSRCIRQLSTLEVAAVMDSAKPRAKKPPQQPPPGFSVPLGWYAMNVTGDIISIYGCFPKWGYPNSLHGLLKIDFSQSKNGWLPGGTPMTKRKPPVFSRVK